MLHVADIFNIYVVEPPVNIDDDGDGHCRFRCCHRDDEQGKEMSLQVTGVKVFIENDKIDGDRVQHQFQRHQDGDEVTAHQEAINPDKEHDRGDDQEMDDWNAFYHDDWFYRLIFFLFCDDDCSYHCGQKQDGNDLKRQDKSFFPEIHQALSDIPDR